LAKKKEQKKNKTWIFIAIIIALAALFALAFVKPAENIAGTTQGQGQQTSPTEVGGDICKRDLECFLVNCKSTPSIIDCVNSTHQDLYYKECGNDWKNVVLPTQNFTKCGCVQGICKIK